MLRLFIVAAAASALATSAFAQAAYTPADGPAPASYPPCTSRVQDRCIADSAAHAHARRMLHKAAHRHAAAKASVKTS